MTHHRGDPCPHCGLARDAVPVGECKGALTIPDGILDRPRSTAHQVLVNVAGGAGYFDRQVLAVEVVMNEEWWRGYAAALAALAANAAEIERITGERDELQQVFDMRWSADMRAIKRWQEAHPGNDLVWPDHADLVVWLMEQLHV